MRHWGRIILLRAHGCPEKNYRRRLQSPILLTGRRCLVGFRERLQIGTFRGTYSALCRRNVLGAVAIVVVGGRLSEGSATAFVYLAGYWYCRVGSRTHAVSNGAALLVSSGRVFHAMPLSARRHFLLPRRHALYTVPPRQTCHSRRL